MVSISVYGKNTKVYCDFHEEGDEGKGYALSHCNLKVSSGSRVFYHSTRDTEILLGQSYVTGKRAKIGRKSTKGYRASEQEKNAITCSDWQSPTNHQILLFSFPLIFY
jgi:hypothetical protein